MQEYYIVCDVEIIDDSGKIFPKSSIVFDRVEWPNRITPDKMGNVREHCCQLFLKQRPYFRIQGNLTISFIVNYANL